MNLTMSGILEALARMQEIQPSRPATFGSWTTRHSSGTKQRRRRQLERRTGRRAA